MATPQVWEVLCTYLGRWERCATQSPSPTQTPPDANTSLSLRASLFAKLANSIWLPVFRCCGKQAQKLQAGDQLITRLPAFQVSGTAAWGRPGDGRGLCQISPSKMRICSLRGQQNTSQASSFHFRGLRQSEKAPHLSIHLQKHLVSVPAEGHTSQEVLRRMFCPLR